MAKTSLLARLTRLARLVRRTATARIERRWRRSTAAESVSLAVVRRRLELLLTGMYGRELHIEASELPASPGLLARFSRRQPRHLRTRAPIAASDGMCIRLPADLQAPDGTAALAEYRLLALEQAERIVRGTAELAPPETDRLTRDLYLLRESAVVDRRLAESVRIVRPTLAAARAAALARRPRLEVLTPVERDVEALVRQVLHADPALTGAGSGDTPADSLAWAHTTADRLRRASSQYRGLPPVDLWGTLLPAERSVSALASGAGVEERTSGSGDRLGLPGRGSKAGGHRPGDREDTSGVGRGTAGDQAARSSSPGGSALPSARIDAQDHTSLHTTDAASGSREKAVDLRVASAHPHAGGDSVPVAASATEATGSLASMAYPEWDQALNRYRPNGAMVHSCAPAEGSSAWADDTLREHAALVRRIRQRFERLRSRRSRLGRQREGEELDLGACVGALVDWRTGHAPDDRLYVAVRPARRALAITLLVDISGSTDTPVTDTQTVIDVEKTAVLLASQALDALGDQYAVMAFSGRGATNVRVATLKGFGERNGDAVRRRVSALAPEGNTRLGAAVRHATARLAQQPAGHRLLLLLSDGRPNDADGYLGRYAVEDARQAIVEARSVGVYPFCLTVDRAAAEYLGRIFGAAGHSILRQPEHLPLALVQVVRQLLAS